MRLSWGSVAPACLAILATGPLLAGLPFAGLDFRLASNAVLAQLSPTEQSMSVRTLTGAWALGLPVIWFGLAYTGKGPAQWETPLVLLGAALASVQTGNAWVEALAMVLPLARQVRGLNLTRPLVVGVGLALIGLSVANLTHSRRPELPPSATAAAMASHGERVFADWEWAGELQRQLGPSRTVPGAAGLHAASTEYWADYLRASQGHAAWASVLDRLGVEVVVVDAAATQLPLGELIRRSPSWRVLDDSDGALVAERTRPP
ncbi:MAG: hypothetical protein ACR2IK_09140 [Chloroflexota bacterium]